MTQAVDEAKLGEFMGQMVGYMTGGAMCFGVWLGDELGLYRVLNDLGPASADEVAGKAGCNPRLVREWLDGQVAGQLVSWDESTDHYALSPEAALALADDNSPAFVARAMNAFGSMFIDMTKIADAFRGDGALSWGDHHPCLFSGTEWFFRTGYRAELPSWIAALDGVADKLAAGGRVADVGCGHGASMVVLADAFPEARITGIDFHGPSIDVAKQRVEEAGVSGQTAFEVADGKSYAGTFDLICFFDCLHDMGDPVGIARYALDHLADDGTVLLVEPYAIDGRGANIADNPMAALLYTASSAICTPNSLSQEVGLGLGAQAGEARLRDGPRGGRVHAVPSRRRNAAQPHPRGEALRATVLPACGPARPEPNDTKERPMNGLTAKSFETPDEVRSPDKTKVEVIDLVGVKAARLTLQPGWKWSECIKPVAGTDSCQAHHVGVIVSGTMHVRHDDGSESDLTSGMGYVIEPGHDAWVVGDEPAISFEFDSSTAQTFATPT